MPIQLHFDESKKGFSFRSDKEGGEYFLGLLCVGCATMTSGFAGVYNEKMMKNGQQPLLFVRSLQISTYCIRLNLLVEVRNNEFD